MHGDSLIWLGGRKQSFLKLLCIVHPGKDHIIILLNCKLRNIYILNIMFINLL